MLAHSVFFALHDSSPAAIESFLAAGRRDLDGHPGVVFFAIGTLNPDLKRPVNDRDFDVGLHVVFESRASHDAYQVDPRHLRFLEETKPNWKRARVFDVDL